MNNKELKNIVGQLFILGFYGEALKTSDQIIRDISEENLGGVILFDRHLATGRNDNNIINKEQLKRLTRSLQKATAAGDSSLLIAIDQEGGMVNRFKGKQEFSIETPSAGELGKDDSLEKTRTAAAQTAKLLNEMGININFAPVADVNIFSQNPIIGKFGRSFSDRAETVARHCSVWIDEHHKQEILTCVKHFPGHGSSHTDSHHGFTDISNSWKREELQPYKMLAAQQKIDAVMVGHLFHQDFDIHHPATLSTKTIAMLQSELHSQIVTISDDMQMKAITKQYALPEACAKSIAAGVDLIIVGNNIDYDVNILQKIKKRVLQDLEEGLISERRIVNAWQKVQQLKMRIRKK